MSMVEWSLTSNILKAFSTGACEMFSLRCFWAKRKRFNRYVVHLTLTLILLQGLLFSDVFEIKWPLWCRRCRPHHFLLPFSVDSCTTLRHKMLPPSHPSHTNAVSYMSPPQTSLSFLDSNAAFFSIAIESFTCLKTSRPFPCPWYRFLGTLWRMWIHGWVTRRDERRGALERFGDIACRGLNSQVAR